jgi:hypothetical protein
MNRVTTVQVCDATEDDQGTEAGNIKSKTSNIKLSLGIHHFLLMIDTFHMHRIKILRDEFFA